MQQRRVLHRLAGGVEGGLELAAAVLEHRDVGALEREDRLLRVAHHEQRARPVVGALAGGELGRQPLDHPPLRGRGVLRLVHEDVVDPAVEPEQHPLRHRRILEEARGAQDQVVEVEPPAGPPGRRIAGAEGVAEALQRQRAGGVGEREPPGPGRLDPRHQLFDLVHERRAGAAAQRLGGPAAKLG